MASRPSPVTRPTGAAVTEFVAGVADENRRTDALALCALMQDVTGEPPAMWGAAIIGFGSYHYRYDSGHEGDAPLVSFSPRKQNLVVYLVGGYEERYPTLLERLGPHKTGKGCLYLRRLAAVDETVLRELIDRTVRVHRSSS